MSKTTITFTDEHLTVIQKALEAYSRAKMGQFRNWFTETFGWQHDWDTGADIEKFIRLRAIEQHLEKKLGEAEVKKKREDYFTGRFSNITTEGFLNSYYEFINTFPQTEDEPFPRHPNASWGILQKERVGDGELAYEIYQTLRQYTAVTQNGGLFDHYTSTSDPLNYSGIQLPEIQGFVKFKDYHFNKAESKKLHKFCVKENWVKAWEYINKSLTPKYKIPSGELRQIRWETYHCDVSQMEFPKEDKYYVRVVKPRKEEKLFDAGMLAVQS